MHASEIRPDVLERVFAMRGGEAPILVDPAKTAHVIVDLQVGFMREGAIAEVPVAREIVPQVNRISAAVRDAGGVNAFIRFTVDFDEPHYWEPMYGRMTPEARASFVAAFAPGAEQHALAPDLDVAPQDLIIDKTRFSAFIPGTCDLDAQLRARGIDTLIVTGTVTNCCCESTVRDAMQMGYKVLFVQDGNASFDDAAHNATLSNMAGLFFADVCTADEAIARLGAGVTSRAAA
jgi:ureidoacrylate peracid hydrolase